MNPRERDDFYLSKPKDADDGDEYELEPPDADVIAGEERRAQEVIEASQATIDIDEIYRDAARQRSDEILDNWLRDFKFRFQFQIKHLLIATAVLAIVLTLAKWGALGTIAVIGVMLTVAALFFYFQWQEKKAEDEAARRRREMYARRRAHHEKMSGAGQPKPAPMSAPPLAADSATTSDAEWEKATTREKFRFRFSVRELLIAMTTAAIIFGLIRALGGPSNTATVLGFVALLGLIIHALGFEPPNVVVLGWWLVLVLYVALSVFAAALSGVT
jgi:hypothetical protein